MKAMPSSAPSLLTTAVRMCVLLSPAARHRLSAAKGLTCCTFMEYRDGQKRYETIGLAYIAGKAGRPEPPTSLKIGGTGTIPAGGV